MHGLDLHGVVVGILDAVVAPRREVVVRGVRGLRRARVQVVLADTAAEVQRLVVLRRADRELDVRGWRPGDVEEVARSGHGFRQDHGGDFLDLGQKCGGIGLDGCGHGQSPLEKINGQA